MIQNGKSTIDGWKDARLGDVLELKRGYDLPQQARLPGSVPIVSSSGISGAHSEPAAKAPGVVTGRYGTLGQVFFMKEDFWPLNTTLYVRDFKGNDPRFIKYLLQTIDFLAYSDKAAVPGLNRNHLHEARIRLPSCKHTQRAIAHVLGTLDDKIDLNIRTSQTLEAIARALFKDWFVDFGPVRTKVDGRDNYLSSHLWALFPSALCETPIGTAPATWMPSTLKHLTTKIGSGATPRGGKEVYVEHGVALIRSQNVYDAEFVWDGLARITDDAAAQLAGVTVQAEDVLLNITGASILRTCIVDPAVLPARVNQHVAIIRASAGVPSRFLHLHLMQAKTKTYLLGMNAGASREAVTKAHIESVPVLLPGQALLEDFGKLVGPMYSEVEALSAENRTLAVCRDLLLPKLISGELQIKDAERFIDEVTS